MNAARFAIWVLVALAIVGCQAAADPQDTVPDVSVDRIEIHDNAFDPPVVEVPAGTTITWVFTDGGRSHNVVSDGFGSDVLSDGTFAHTFTNPGTHDYTCTLHSGMDGRVVVTDA